MLLLRLAQRVHAAQSPGHSCRLGVILKEGGLTGRLRSRGEDHISLFQDASLRSTHLRGSNKVLVRSRQWWMASHKGGSRWAQQMFIFVLYSLIPDLPRLVNPALLTVLRPVTKFLAVLVGRGFRKWWQSLPQHKRQIFIDHLQRNRLRYAAGSGIVGTAGFVYYHNHVTITPYTGRRRFMLLTSDQLFSMSSQLYDMEMEKYSHLMLPQDHPMVDHVRRVGNRLLQANSTLPELYTKSWTVSLIDDSLMNCFVLPTGDIVMFTGMMEILENDDQVAAILAHEMSHAILDHAAEHLNRGYLLDLVILVPVALIWAVLPSDLLAMVSHWLLNLVVTLFLTLPYSRTLESEADYLGLRLAAKACYDVREFSALWGKMAVLEKIKEKKGQGADVPAWMSTHPTNEDRQKELEEQMAEAYDLRQSCKCPPLSLRDPRETIKRLQQIVAQQGTQMSPKAIPLQKPLVPSSGEVIAVPTSSSS